jgi:predicted naringenin-chalcone synthase
MLLSVSEESRSVQKLAKSQPICDILGLGTALPPHAINQVDAAAAASRFCCSTSEQARWLSVVYQRSRVDTRYLAVVDDPAKAPSFYPPATNVGDHGPTTGQRVQRYNAEAPTLAFEAASQALERSGLTPPEITHLVTVSCTGFAAPGVDLRLIQSLGISRTVQRTHIGFMGCHGALNGLQVVRAVTGSDPLARVLLCAVEVCSVHFQYGWNPDQIVASALFAGGAAALVGVPASAGPSDAWRVAATGSCLFPDSEDAMTWRIGDHGFEMTLAVQVPDLIREHLGSWLQEWLARNHLRIEDIGSWAVHPGGPRILDAVGNALKLPRIALDASREVLAECGNMSSTTVLFILDRLRHRQASRPCLMLAFGPGLIAEVALLT